MHSSNVRVRWEIERSIRHQPRPEGRHSRLLVRAFKDLRSGLWTSHTPGPELDAWAEAARQHLGTKPLRVLELACGTGEVTNVLLSLGHEVTALDFSEHMLAVAKCKHAGNPKARFILADAENTMEPDGDYDAVVCRHLVWTLTDAERAFSDWHRVLRSGGKLLIFDGDWAKPAPFGRLALFAIGMIDRMLGKDHHYDGALVIATRISWRDCRSETV